MFDTFLQVFAGCSRLGQTAALQCIRLWELQRPGGDGSGEAWLPGGDGNFSNSSGLDSASRRVNNLSNTEYTLLFKMIFITSLRPVRPYLLISYSI